MKKFLILAQEYLEVEIMAESMVKAEEEIYKEFKSQGRQNFSIMDIIEVKE